MLLIIKSFQENIEQSCVLGCWLYPWLVLNSTGVIQLTAILEHNSVQYSNFTGSINSDTDVVILTYPGVCRKTDIYAM